MFTAIFYASILTAIAAVFPMNLAISVERFKKRRLCHDNI